VLLHCALLCALGELRQTATGVVRAGRGAGARLVRVVLGLLDRLVAAGQRALAGRGLVHLDRVDAEPLEAQLDLPRSQRDVWSEGLCRLLTTGTMRVCATIEESTSA
jgi:hypothetical protein